MLKERVLRAVQTSRSRWLNEDSLLLQGRMASWQVRSQKVVSSIRDVEFRVSSQWGQDGIIDWLVERAAIPLRSQTFVEFGVESYREANTRFLMQNRNWRGLVMDGSDEMVRIAQEDGLTWKHDLTLLPAFITRDNINDLIRNAGFTGNLGLLSIDIDGNDYWVWEAIEVVRPLLAVCEYNAVFGDVYPISVPYNPSFAAGEAHYSHLYFGASIAALRSLGIRKGYRFVGTTTAGNDAFFVREDYAQRFVDTSLERIEALPSHNRSSRDRAGNLSYVRGMKRFQEIAEMPVVHVETGETVKLGDLKSPYSQEWMEAFSE